VVAAAAGSSRLLFLNPQLDLGVGIDYPMPRSIGSDRLANAAAVAQLYGYPAIVVDFGTAVTFDVVSARGDYVGGVIAPGLEAMTSFLYDRTALLPKLSLREPVRAREPPARRDVVGRFSATAGWCGLVRVSRESFLRPTESICDGWVCATDRAKASPDKSRSSESDSGGFADHRESQR
jgi:type III pantothenate kinase